MTTSVSLVLTCKLQYLNKLRKIPEYFSNHFKVQFTTVDFRCSASTTDMPLHRREECNLLLKEN